MGRQEADAEIPVDDEIFFNGFFGNGDNFINGDSGINDLENLDDYLDRLKGEERRGFGQKASQTREENRGPDEKSYNEDRAEGMREQLQKEGHAVRVRECGGYHFARSSNR